MITEFSFASAPHIHFGAGKRKRISDVLSGFGKRVLLVTGGEAFDRSDHCQEIQLSLDKEGFEIQRLPEIQGTHYLIQDESWVYPVPGGMGRQTTGAKQQLI